MSEYSCDLYPSEPIGMTNVFLEMLSKCDQIAAKDVNVLILGETGVGKDLIAHYIHSRSKRDVQLMVPINCTAIPKELIESTLFGHVAGAFTGARTTEIGLIEQAHGGTLFLDEIGEATHDLQLKLLRFLDRGFYRQVGSVQQKHSNVRLITATNRTVEALRGAEGIRADLFYRIATVIIKVPSLRERIDDMPSLVMYFVKELGYDGIKFSKDAYEKLMEYHWPGNVRELRNTIHEALLFHTDLEISSDDISLHEHETSKPVDTLAFDDSILSFAERVSSFERFLITSALITNKHNVTRAALELKISRTTLISKIVKLNIVREL